MTQNTNPLAELVRQLENRAHRKGELWERCQGKAWPEKESNEFHELRDERLPALKAQIEALTAHRAAAGEMAETFDSREAIRVTVGYVLNGLDPSISEEAVKRIDGVLDMVLTGSPPASAERVPGLTKAQATLIFEVLQYYANVCTYQGERTGGVLAGCPRKPAPGPDQLVYEARRAFKQLEDPLRAIATGKPSQASSVVPAEPFGYVLEHPNGLRHYTRTKPTDSEGMSESEISLYTVYLGAGSVLPGKSLNEESEREAFEKWALKTQCNTDDLERGRLTGYRLPELNRMWVGWRARALGSAVPDRQPLSEEQIWFLTEDGMRNAAGGIYADRVLDLVRAVEKTHGIKDRP